MVERARLFDGGEDFDVSSFTPKKTGRPAAQPPEQEAIRAVSEPADFRSREPLKAPVKKALPRRRRTGRNLQLNLKVDAKTLESFYQITDRQGWVLGKTLEMAIAALEKELAPK